jgi:hypothetical protein
MSGEENLGAFCGCAAKPGFPLQLLALPRCGVSAAIPGAWAADRFALPTRGFAHGLLAYLNLLTVDGETYTILLKY